jgi:hypothetical protein
MYPEEVDITGRTFAGGIPNSSIELRGDPAAPNNYIITGATVGAPKAPARNNVVVCSYANCILDGVSLQYGAKNGFVQYGGNSVLYATSLHHFTSSSSSTAVVMTNGSLSEIRGNFVISDVANGIELDDYATLTGYRQQYDVFNTGWPQNTKIVITGVTTGAAIGLYEHAFYDVSFTTSLKGISSSSSSGISIWDFSTYDSETTNISNFGIGVNIGVFSRLEINQPSLTNVTTGINADFHSQVDWLRQDPVFINVPTQYALEGASSVTTPTQTLFPGTLTSTGAINLSAGGTNQNITLTPSGSGNIILNGLVGIGAPSKGAKLTISSPGGSQTYLDVADESSNNDTLVNLNAAGDSGNTYFLKASQNGSSQWWVKSDGSTFSTSSSTGVNNVPSSADPVFDASLGNAQTMTLTGDVLSSTLSNASPGQTLIFVICQDGNGGHKFSWPPNIKGGVRIGSMTPFGAKIGGAPNTCTAQPFIVIGTNAYSLGPGSADM